MTQDRVREKQSAVKAAEDAGEVADSMDVRLALVERMNRGEMTLAEVQTELKRIKRNAAKDGKTTRNRVFRQS